jgi:uncharacterized protein
MSKIDCREGCGACCIVPSISSPIPGMPLGKPAFTPCIHLSIDFRCGIFDSPDRPKVCAEFQAETLVCGNHREDAIRILGGLEKLASFEFAEHKEEKRERNFIPHCRGYIIFLANPIVHEIRNEVKHDDW